MRNVMRLSSIRASRKKETHSESKQIEEPWRSNDPALVATPAGNPARLLTLSAVERFLGAHTNDRRYFDRPDEPGRYFDRPDCCGRVLRLKTWTFYHYASGSRASTLELVPAGRWECILKCRSSAQIVPDFVRDWNIGTGLRHSRDREGRREGVDDVGECHLRHKRDGALLTRLPSNCLYLSFGVIELDNEADVRFEMSGDNSHWCSGLDFDSLELRRCSPPWQVVRLLLLGADASRQPGVKPERPGCELARLPPDVLRHIVMMLTDNKQDGVTFAC